MSFLFEFAVGTFTCFCLGKCSFKITTQRVIHKISQDLIKHQSSAMERAAKLQRLHYMRRSLPHISASALAAVLEDVQKFGNVDLHQRKHIRESTEKELSKWNAYGPLFHELTLVGFEHPVQVVAVNVLTLFFAAFNQGGGWANLMMNLMQQSPPSPSNKYGLAIYSDEVVPGNTVAPDNLRKIWVIYASLIQFGPVALSQEASWLTIGCCRSSCLSLVKGGIGQLIKEILKKTFQDTNFDVTQAGFVLKSKGGEHHRIWLDLQCIVQDGAAHRATFSVKGDSGTRCCLLCKNVVSTKSGLVDEDGAAILATEFVKASQLDLTTDNDVWKTIKTLKDKHKTL